ncbi:MAG TPA: redox-regulated ATPase YchF [Thermodesulfobacteriota bacterium]|nr:redox-regulated ATPase YchF [Thermodesulfobacteriota bacterium]
MGFKCGIVGLPNAGKSTIFNALTAAKAEVASYPFSTIQPHEGIAPVPDLRLKEVARIIQPKKTIPATLEVWDIAGLVKGASQGEGLGNQFLSHIRNVDALIHVVRCFEDENIAPAAPSIEPRRDIDIVNTELLLADLEIVSRRITKIEKLARVGEKQYREELAILKKIESGLNNGISIRHMLTLEGEIKGLHDIQLLTSKPVLYVANVSEKASKGEGIFREKVIQIASEEKAPVVTICGKLEAELEDLDDEERKAFLKEYGLKQSGLEILVAEGYHLLNLIVFYTVVSKELRAWTVVQGTKALEAAGKIHSDMEKGFIKAEVISYQDFISAGSLTIAKEKGMIAQEGRDYEVKDGDIITLKFNV